MIQINTQGIVLSRINYQEADRILTVLTPDYGKVSLLAKGVRRAKSKNAGGIELFSIGEITFIKGKGDLSTLTSGRINTNYGNIIKDINRTMLGYEFLKRINKITEDDVEVGYFELLKKAFAGLDDINISRELVELWFTMQLLELSGHAPNLSTDTKGEKLASENTYVFSFDDMAFASTPQGSSIANVAKLLRLSSSRSMLDKIAKVQGIEDSIPGALQIAKTMQKYSLHL